MKTKKYLPVLIILTAIICTCACGDIEPPELLNHGLIGRPYPALAGMETFYIELKPDVNINISTLGEIHKKVAHKFDEAGIKIIHRPFLDANVKPLQTPEFRIDINTLKLKDSQQYVFHIQTSLTRLVTLPAQRNPHFQVDVWKTKPLMQVVSAENMPAKVTNAVIEQVEVFIQAYLTANPKDKQPAPADTNNITTIPKERVKLPARPAATGYKYVASKNRKVFHKPDCSSAKRIKPENLTGYNNRNEAIKAGKRPCKRCKPQ